MRELVGVAYRKGENQVRVTYSEWNGTDYAHIREYIMDGDTGNWYPSKSGYALLADEVSSIIPLLQLIEEHQAQKTKPTRQLSFDFMKE